MIERIENCYNKAMNDKNVSLIIIKKTSGLKRNILFRIHS